jgi:hypothetical protein
MRMRQIIKGLKNSQRIRVIVNGVGFETTVEGMTRMTFTSQRVAIWGALDRIAMEKIQGFASSSTFYDGRMQRECIDFQVSLI